MPRLDMDVETSEVQDPIASRREVLRPLPPHSLAAHDEEAMAIGHDENRYIVRLAGLAPEGRERDLSIIFRGVDHILAEAAYVEHNRSQAPEIPLNNRFSSFSNSPSPVQDFLGGVPNRTSYELQLPAELTSPIRASSRRRAEG